MTFTRRRPSSAVANDLVIEGAAVSLLARQGSANFTLAAVARRAGLSKTTTASRFANRDELLCQVWNDIARARIDDIVRWATSKLALTDATTGEPEIPQLKTLLQQNEDNLALSELLAVSATTPLLRDAVRATFASHLGEVAKSEPIRAAQLSFLVAVVLGTLFELRTTRTTATPIIELINEIADAISEPSGVIALPDVDASHMGVYAFETGDERRDRVLASCLTNVGRHGFESTTTKKIAEVAGVSEGLVFSMFKSKLDIFFEAVTRQARRGYRDNLDFVINLYRDHGPGIANAILIKEWLSPRLTERRVTVIEQTRLAWHDARLRRRINQVKDELMSSNEHERPSAQLPQEKTATQFIELAIPMGIYVLAESFPDAVTLPFSAVTQEAFE